MRKIAFVSAVALGLAMIGAVAQAADASSYPIAGLTPNHRPLGAPAITTVKKDAAWYERALKGIDAPYPASVEKTVKDQGNWYSPFTLPGMSGKYDIRHWHG